MCLVAHGEGVQVCGRLGLGVGIPVPLSPCEEGILACICIPFQNDYLQLALLYYFSLLDRLQHRFEKLDPRRNVGFELLELGEVSQPKANPDGVEGNSAR